MITGQYGSGISFSQGVEKGSPAEVDNTTATLLPPVAARWWFPEDASLRQDQVLPSIPAFLQPNPHIQPSFDNVAYVMQILACEYFG